MNLVSQPKAAKAHSWNLESQPLLLVELPSWNLESQPLLLVELPSHLECVVVSPWRKLVVYINVLAKEIWIDFN